MSIKGVKLVQIDLPPQYVTIDMPQDADGRFIDMGREGPEWEQIEAHIRITAANGGNYAERGGVGDCHTADVIYKCGGQTGRGPGGCNKFRPADDEQDVIGTCTFVEGDINGKTGSCRYWELTGLNDFELDLKAHKISKEDADYGERPNGIQFGCTNCQTWVRAAKSADSQGRNLFCTFWGCRVRQPDSSGYQGCCQFNAAPGDIAFDENEPVGADGMEPEDDDDKTNSTATGINEDGAKGASMISMNRYGHILQAFYSTPWAILPEKLEAIKALINLRASGVRVSDEEIKAVVQAASRPSPRTAGSVAVIPVYGVISHRMNMMAAFSGGTSTESLTKTFRQALNDDTVKAIIFDIDSPGGSVDGVAELADEIFNARGGKKMVAVSNTLAASAAYWLACCADEVVVSPSGNVGSIGVYMVHDDISKMNENIGLKPTYISAGKYKVEANPDTPLSADALNALQSSVDGYYDMFTNAVARARGVGVSDVKNGFGEGRLVMAKAAVKAKMADRVATLDQTLARFGASDQVKQMAASADDQIKMLVASGFTQTEAEELYAICEEKRKSTAAGPKKTKKVKKADDGGEEEANEGDCECECEGCVAGSCEDCTLDPCESPGCTCPQHVDDPSDEESRASALPEHVKAFANNMPQAASALGIVAGKTGKAKKEPKAGDECECECPQCPDNCEECSHEPCDCEGCTCPQHEEAATLVPDPKVKAAARERAMRLAALR